LIWEIPVYEYEPGKRDETIKRGAKKGSMSTAKIIGEWADVRGKRIFRMYQCNDTKTMLTTTMRWDGLGKKNTQEALL
jgi:hypothetical protein